METWSKILTFLNSGSNNSVFGQFYPPVTRSDFLATFSVPPIVTLHSNGSRSDAFAVTVWLIVVFPVPNRRVPWLRLPFRTPFSLCRLLFIEHETLSWSPS